MKRYNLRRMVAYGRHARLYRVRRQDDRRGVRAEGAGRRDRRPVADGPLRAGYTVRRILLDFLWDNASLNYSTLLEMPNPNYQPEKRRIAAAPLQRVVRRIRICAAQWFMRPHPNLADEFAQTVNFFVDTANTYHSHFLLLPELFTAQLFSMMPADLDSREAIRRLASMTDRYIDLFSDLAEKHGLYIIAGSQPELRDGEIYNVAYLFTPSGDVLQPGRAAHPAHRAHRLRHRTGRRDRSSTRRWGASASRSATMSSSRRWHACRRWPAPRSSSSPTAPTSVKPSTASATRRRRARWRTFIYVVIAGNVGNLPTSKNYLINYGQAAVFTPSDFAFPPAATAGESEANVETVLITDLDLTVAGAAARPGDGAPSL
jgi:predicted amidohydrolase